MSLAFDIRGARLAVTKRIGRAGRLANNRIRLNEDGAVDNRPSLKQ